MSFLFALPRNDIGFHSNAFGFLLRGHNAVPRRELQGERLGPLYPSATAAKPC
jgi:hypothetical protein